MQLLSADKRACHWQVVRGPKYFADLKVSQLRFSMRMRMVRLRNLPCHILLAHLSFLLGLATVIGFCWNLFLQQVPWGLRLLMAPPFLWIDNWFQIPLKIREFQNRVSCLCDDAPLHAHRDRGQGHPRDAGTTLDTQWCSKRWWWSSSTSLSPSLSPL